MRFGVSAKIFLAYAVLLVAFAATSLFTLLYLHSARQQVEANKYLSEVWTKVDTAIHHLERFEPSARLARPPVYFPAALDNLDAARAKVDDFLALEDLAPEHERGFRAYREQLAGLRGRLAEAAKAGHPYWEGGDDGFPERLLALRKDLEILRMAMVKEQSRTAEELLRAETRAANATYPLGGVGFAVAIAAALLMWRTLRPLKTLRLRARQIAGGDYGRRIGVRSRDEIGDLAREFDAMAAALEEREQRLIRSERLAAVGRVAAQITHEIRNPLASIGLNTELLADELPPDGEEGRRLIAAIAAEVDRLSEITETYLRFVRLPRPKVELEDLGALVSSSLEFSRAELRQAGVALELDIAPGLPPVAADENQIRQALLNLVRNAKEAMSGGGRVRVEVGPGEGGRVRIAVTDTGPGIAPEDQGKIFDPFFSTKEKGTGLGLALVQQIVHEHGGRIDLESPAEGGTRFVLWLPCGGPPGAAPEIKAPAAGPAVLALPMAKQVPGR
jgi:signal transduction histidine kinase